MEAFLVGGRHRLQASGTRDPQALVAPTLNGGYTESQMYRRLGIKCYGFVPIEVKSEDEATEHAANERVPVEQIRRGVKMFSEVVMRAANEQ